MWLYDLYPVVVRRLALCFLFFFNDPATTEIYTLSLHDALPIYWPDLVDAARFESMKRDAQARDAEGTSMLTMIWKRSEEHTSELQSLRHLVCRLLLEKKKKKTKHKKMIPIETKTSSVRSRQTQN